MARLQLIVVKLAIIRYRWRCWDKFADARVSPILKGIPYTTDNARRLWEAPSVGVCGPCGTTLQATCQEEYARNSPTQNRASYSMSRSPGSPMSLGIVTTSNPPQLMACMRIRNVEVVTHPYGSSRTRSDRAFSSAQSPPKDVRAVECLHSVQAMSDEAEGPNQPVRDLADVNKVGVGASLVSTCSSISGLFASKFAASPSPKDQEQGSAETYEVRFELVDLVPTWDMEDTSDVSDMRRRREAL
ncbi:uncharacterized protein FIBRA_02743 [Fibroporia radiculosa]|uniref:Uncharacterized protein n=1 Tax=Fibroporia radiculosa TaxID=599839 RepID=J4G2K4_9APHY|nr:uncharacterized protein FIBRA_02743 [Fibroporia radiculosa]CCM00703.1 predicted protein [Fibroporia radiculosa]